MTILLYIIIGIIAGAISGAFGIGGGTLMVPLFVIAFGLSQHQAQGTALAVMLPPVFLLAVMRYYYAGNVKVQMAVYIAIGFFIGALLGAQVVQGLPDQSLKRAFGIFLVIVGIKMAFLK